MVVQAKRPLMAWCLWAVVLFVELVAFAFLVSSVPDQLRIGNRAHLVTVVILLSLPTVAVAVWVLSGRRLLRPRWIFVSSIPAFAYGLVVMGAS